MLKKTIHKQKSDFHSNRGKPSGIKETELEAPKIWTNLHECSTVIKFLYDQGRHIGLHQAGRDFDNEKRKKEKEQIKAKAKYYEIAQNVAIKLFGIPKIAARLTVFFFRLPNDESYQSVQEQIYDLEGKLREVLLQISFLLNKKFIEDWILIAKLQQEGKNVIEEMIYNKHTPKQFSQIFQNEYIKHILDDMMENNNVEKYSMQSNDLDEDFLEFCSMKSTKSKVSHFIQQLLEHYQGQNPQQQYQPDFQSDVYFEQSCNVSNYFNDNNSSDPIFL